MDYEGAYRREFSTLSELIERGVARGVELYDLIMHDCSLRGL